MNSGLFYSFLNTKSLGRNFIDFHSLDSTSTYLRQLSDCFCHGTTVCANEQLNGRGRTGKSFFSPAGTGLYFSFLLKQNCYTSDPLLTSKLSYAVLCAIDKLTGTTVAGIKWVNDIYNGQKKLAGILCERVSCADSDTVIVGIGINITFSSVLAPADIKNKAAGLNSLIKKKISKEELCAEILNQLEDMYENSLSNHIFIDLYRNRSVVLGKEINVIKDGLELRAAALDIDLDGALVVRYESGITEKITAGEISIIIK